MHKHAWARALWTLQVLPLLCTYQDNVFYIFFNLCPAILFSLIDVESGDFCLLFKKKGSPYIFALSGRLLLIIFSYFTLITVHMLHCRINCLALTSVNHWLKLFGVRLFLSIDSSILGTVLLSESKLSEGCLHSHWAISVYWKAEHLLEEPWCCDCSSLQLLITYGRHRMKCLSVKLRHCTKA